MDQDKWALVQSIDLNSVKVKLSDKKGWWWRLWHNVDNIEKEYRQFLYLAVMNPEEVVVPWTQVLDDFWHEHILDTAKYEKDCQTLFGKMFHHNPHLPIGSLSQVKAFNKTKEMYKEAFGEKAKAKSTSSVEPGCSGGTAFVPVFCAGGCDSHSHSHDCSHSDGHSCGGHSDGGGHSCGGHSCGGSSCGSSCGGGGCGGGGD